MNTRDLKSTPDETPWRKVKRAFLGTLNKVVPKAAAIVIALLSCAYGFFTAWLCYHSPDVQSLPPFPRVVISGFIGFFAAAAFFIFAGILGKLLGDFEP